MRIGCLIQARLGSERLPRKVLADIGGWPMIKHVVKRMRTFMPVVVIAPVADGDEIHKALGTDAPVYCPEVDPNDVLKRYFYAARDHGFDAVARVTGDCPLVDPLVANDLVEIAETGRYDYVANDIAHTFPDGLGVEIMSLTALRWANSQAMTPGDREHVSLWIKRYLRPKGIFESFNYVCPVPELAGLKFSVDTQEDLERVRKIDEAKPADHSLDATMAAYRRAYP